MTRSKKLSCKREGPTLTAEATLSKKYYLIAFTILLSGLSLHSLIHFMAI